MNKRGSTIVTTVCFLVAFILLITLGAICTSRALKANRVNEAKTVVLTIIKEAKSDLTSDGDEARIGSLKDEKGQIGGYSVEGTILNVYLTRENGKIWFKDDELTFTYINGKYIYTFTITTNEIPYPVETKR